jgi:putative methyltransferase
MKIGFVHLPISNNLIHYPLSWLIVKTTVETKSKNKFNFLDPIIHNHEIDDAYLKNSDILMVSLYAWNRNLTMKIVDRYRNLNPKGVIIAGGPHTLENDTEIFEFVVTNEAETCIHLIVDKIKGEPIDRIPCTKSKSLSEYFVEKITDFSVSAYLFQKDTILDLKEKFSSFNMSIILETNRGCPYGCTFCDWGSSTLSKIRQRPFDVVKAEIEFIASLDPNYVYLADANFGILPRDVEIAKIIADVKSKTNQPKNMYVSYSKNNLDRNLEIADILFSSGATSNYTFSLQHTDKEVLEIIDRINPHIDKLRKLSDKLLEKKIPTFTQLIIGNPGDTPKKWRKCLYDVFELNLHEELRMYYFCVLPGSPAADKNYIDQHALQFSTVNYFNQSSKEKDPDQMSDIIIGCKTFDSDDWIKMNIFGRLIQALHDLGLVKVIAIYLHNKKIKSYQNFYDDLIAKLEENFPELFKDLTLALNEWITTDRTILNWNPDGVSGLEIEEKLCFHFVKNKDKFYQSVIESLHPILNSKIEDLIKWQNNKVIDMEYDPTSGKLCSSLFDWDNWFDNRNWSASISLRTNKYRYVDKQVGVSDWDKQEIIFYRIPMEKRPRMFAYQMFTGVSQRKNRLFLKEIEIVKN